MSVHIAYRGGVALLQLGSMLKAEDDCFAEAHMMKMQSSCKL